MSFIPSYKKPAGSSEYVPPEWSSGTDEEIVEALEKHYAGEVDLTEYWSVGDERTVHLQVSSGSPFYTLNEDVVLVLSNVGGKYFSDGTTECLFQVDFKNCLNSNYSLGRDNMWDNSTMKSSLNTIRLAMPATLRDIFKQFTVQTGYGNRISSIVNSTDYVSLRAEVEILGTNSYSVSGEGSQVTWYETSANRVKTVNNEASTYWLRSPCTSNTTSYCAITSDGSLFRYAGTNSLGIAPFGVI